MPDGGTHHHYFKKGYHYSIPVSVVVSFLDLRIGIGYIAGYSFHRWCDNDWDIFGSNNAEGRLVNEIPVLGHFLYGVSSTYGSIFRRKHRSIITHFPYLSTIIRLLFVFLLPFVLLDYWGINILYYRVDLFFLGFWLGLSHADGIHYYLDLTDKKMKWRKRI